MPTWLNQHFSNTVSTQANIITLMKVALVAGLFYRCQFDAGLLIRCQFYLGVPYQLTSDCTFTLYKLYTSVSPLHVYTCISRLSVFVLNLHKDSIVHI